jgi:oxygen-independent coproporphyrinogen-3 oxidase
VHLYVHVPFCARRCVYCDFSIAVRRAVPVDDFVGGVRQELALRGLGGDTLQTLYLGGGTPSRLGGAGVAALLATIRERFTLAVDAEVTVEANPEDVTEATAAAWRAAGVNRLSLGVQSFDDAVLAWMHRTHRRADTERAVTAARRAGIEDLSLDLIYGLPDALRRDWEADLDALLALAPTHASLYGLTVEPGTPLGRWVARGDAAPTADERWADDCLAAHARLTAAGYAHYEVSNYARPGHRARHNSAYWADRPFLGVGPSAHGFDGRRRRWNVAAYAEWLAALAQGRDPVGGEDPLDAAARAAEAVYLGLRTQDGLMLGPADEAIIAPWLGAGWGRIESRHDSRYLVLSMEGWLRLDALAASLTAARSC